MNLNYYKIKLFLMGVMVTPSSWPLWLLMTFTDPLKAPSPILRQIGFHSFYNHFNGISRSSGNKLLCSYVYRQPSCIGNQLREIGGLKKLSLNQKPSLKGTRFGESNLHLEVHYSFISLGTLHSILGMMDSKWMSLDHVNCAHCKIPLHS